MSKAQLGIISSQDYYLKTIAEVLTLSGLVEVALIAEKPQRLIDAFQVRKDCCFKIVLVEYAEAKVAEFIHLLEAIQQQQPDAMVIAVCDNPDPTLVDLFKKQQITGLLLNCSRQEIVLEAVKAALIGYSFIEPALVRLVIGLCSLPPLARTDALTGVSFTEKELETIAMLRSGMQNKAIAQKSGTSLSNIKQRVSRIFEKTGVSNRYELYALFNE